MRRGRNHRIRFIAAIGLCAVLHGLAQEKPLNLSGVLSAGFYSMARREVTRERLNFVPVGAQFNLSGFLGRPDFLSWEAQPQLVSGPQATDAGFLGGNGISFKTAFLDRRAFPLFFTYQNLRREDFFFGGLTQVSGFRSLNHDRSLGLNWQWRASGWPQLALDWGRSQLDTEPESKLVPSYRSRTRHLNLDAKDERWGWTFDGNYRREKLASRYPSLLAPALQTSDLNQETSRGNLSAHRPLSRTADLTLLGGGYDLRSIFAGQPFDQNVRFADANLGFGHGQRLEGSLRGGYNSNLVGQELQQALSRAGTGLAPAEAILFLPARGRLGHASVGGNVQYALHRDWNLTAGLSKDRVRTSERRLVGPDSDYLTGTAGLHFHHSFSWANVSAGYNRQLGRFVYGELASRLRGDNLSLSVQHGRIERLEIALSGGRSRNRTDQINRFRSGSETAEFGLARRLGKLGLVLRGGAGLDRNFFEDSGYRFHSDGLVLRGGIESRWLQVHYNRSATDGNTIPLLLAGAVGREPRASLLLPYIPVFLAAQRTESFGLHTTPLRRLDAGLLWTHSRQRFGGRLANDFSQIEFRASYRFRLLTFEVGYLGYDQTFLDLMPVLRSRLYFRLSRPFRVF